MNDPTILIVAKAPVPGLAKTRIGRTVGDALASDVAAAALLDTIDVVVAVGWPVVVAMTGDLARAARAEEIQGRLMGATVIDQRGNGLGERLANAHADSDAGHGVVQVGMDTPQISVADLHQAGASVAAGMRVIGPADDGGWWLLGLPDADDAAELVGVPMSQDDTLALTVSAIGGDFEQLRSLRDMDTWGDAVAISHDLPISRLAQVVSAVETRV
jgi:glycosyltransferase A (GT-A) superfamily protein (DUF2064 family)